MTVLNPRFMGLAVLAGLALVALTLAAAIVLFVVGLVKKRTGLWVTGVILGVLSLVVLPVAGFLTFFIGVRSAAVTAGGAQVRAVARAVPQRRSAEFRTCTGLDLPAGAQVVASHSVTFPPPAAQSIYYLRIAVPADFGGFLEANFAEAPWDDVQEALTHKDALDSGVWREADVRAKAYYTRVHRTRPGAPDAMHTAIAYDANAATAYFVSIQKWDE